MFANLFRFTLLFFPALALATQGAICKPEPFLKSGLRVADYQQCQSAIQSCPMVNEMFDLKCAEKIMNTNKSCAQLKQVASNINANANAILAEKAGDYSIIEQTFAADGQKAYYIASKAGCLLNTNVDPKTISSKLRERYRDVNFMTMNMSKPIYEDRKKAGARFATLIRVTKDCRACELIGLAKINFDFDIAGKLSQVTLVSMMKK